MNVKVDLSVPPEDIIDGCGAYLTTAIPMMIDKVKVKGIAVVVNTDEGSFMIGRLDPSWMSQGRRGRD